MEELIKLLAKRHPDIDFTAHNSLIDDGVLTSFDIVSIIAEVSDLFDVVIPPLEIVPENFNSAAALHALIVKLAGE